MWFLVSFLFTSLLLKTILEQILASLLVLVGLYLRVEGSESHTIGALLMIGPTLYIAMTLLLENMSVLTSSIWFAVFLPSYCGFRLHYQKNPLEFLYHYGFHSPFEDNQKAETEIGEAEEAVEERKNVLGRLNDETCSLLTGHLCGWWLYAFSSSFACGATVGALPTILAFYSNWPYRRQDSSKEDWLLLLLLLYAYGMASTCLHYAFWTSAVCFVIAAFTPFDENELPINVSKGIVAVTFSIVLSAVLSEMSWSGIVTVVALTCAAWFVFKVRKEKLQRERREEEVEKERRWNAFFSQQMEDEQEQLEQEQHEQEEEEERTFEQSVDEFAEELPRSPPENLRPRQPEESSSESESIEFLRPNVEDREQKLHDPERCERQIEELKQENTRLRLKIASVLKHLHSSSPSPDNWLLLD